MALYVTKICPFGPYLHIYGQSNFMELRNIQSKIEQHLMNDRNDYKIPYIGQLTSGKFCLAQLKGRYVRANVSELIQDGANYLASINYIDFATKGTVPLQELRISLVPNDIESYPIQVVSFIICGIIFEWQSNHIDILSKEIVGQNVEVNLLFEVAGMAFANVIWKGQNLADYILNSHKLGLPCLPDNMKQDFHKVFFNTQQQVFTKPSSIYHNRSIKGISKYIPPTRHLHSNWRLNNKPIEINNGSILDVIKGIENRETFVNPSYQNMRRLPFESLSQPAKTAVSTFKSTTLLVGNTYQVICANVENGPCTFSVQLKSTEEDLRAMMNKIEDIKQLRNISEKPALGMACLARYSIDNQIYRAIIMNLKINECQVSYIDYGNIENVSYSNIYEIPSEFLEKKCYSIRFALSGYKELEPINDDLKEYFKQNVEYNTLLLKVMPLEGPPLVQYCELYNQNNENILDLLKKYRKRKLQYPSTQTLISDDLVTVCYIESAKLFCVQAVKMRPQFEKMMDDLFMYCKKSKGNLRNFEKGRPCTVKYENAYYRAEVINKTENRIRIRHIDYGIERVVDPIVLNDIPEKYLALPPQGIPCCLKGFEDSEAGFTEKTITQFEMLAETSEGDRREFKAQIYQIFRNNVYLLNLLDETMKPELNLMKRLFKLNMPFNKYIATEKNNFNISKDFVTDIQLQQINISSSTTIQNDNQINANWEKGSTGSQDSKNSNYKNSNRNYQQPNGFQNRGANGRKRGGGVNNRNLPPRFQKQQENRSSTESHNNFSSESSGRFSQTQSSRSSFQQIANNSSSCDWSVDSEESAPVILVEQYLSFEEKIPQIDIKTPTKDEVLICWWSSPLQFYTHSKARTPNFEKMMKNMQVFYKNKSPADGVIPIGSHVIARYRQDNVLYRAKILAYNEELQKYRVEFIDFGNISTVNTCEVYMIEKRFSIEPVMANLCSFENIILNFDHQYIISKIEKYFQARSTVTCNYLYKENTIYFVEIELNTKSFKNMLIQDNLISAITSDIKLELLKNQKIKAKLKSITTLLNFKIEIEGCEVNFLCSYYDIKFAKINSNLLPSFKNNYEEKYCIVEIMNVTSDKILMVQPIIPLFTSVSPAIICSYPVICNNHKVKVSYHESEYKLHLHKSKTDNVLQQLLDDMFEFYERNGQKFDNFVIGSVCACLSSDDGNWYRAQIKSIIEGPNNNDHNSIEVYYFDYGNTEKIELNSNETKFKRLDIKFQELSALSMEIYLPLKSISNAVIKEIENLTLNVELELHVIEYFNNNWICDLKYNDFSLLEQLKAISLIEIDIDFMKDVISNNCNKNMDLKILQPNEFPSSEKMEVPEVAERQEDEPADASHEQKHLIRAYISHFNSPNSFYIQLESKIDELEKIQGNLQIVSTQLPSLVANYTGAICIAKYTVDNTWYRAEIIDNECLAVKYIDYGNTDIIIDGTNDIKEIIEPFNKIEPFSIECSLAIEPKQGYEWTLDEFILSLFNQQDAVEFEFVSKGDKKNFINLYKNGENVSEKILDMNLAKKLEILKNGEKCFISHINNIKDFYLQIDSDSAYLEIISKFLSTSYNEYPIISEDFENKFCAARFTEDDQWYRAKILNRTETGFNVFFIDFGNTADSLECRELPSNITEYPPLAKSCSLRLPQDVEQWSIDAENTFAELSATGETIFTLELKEPKFEKCEIDLFIDNKNILEILVPLCPKKIIDFMNVSSYSDIINNETNTKKKSMDTCSITFGESFEEFYVQLNSSREDLDIITDFLSNTELSTFENDPEIGVICAALYSDDNIFYRAKILEKNKIYLVYFIDYGNTAEATVIRQLPENYMKLSPIVKKCTLHNPKNLKFSSQCSINYFNNLEEVELKIISNDDDTLIVQLFDQTGNIYDKLLESPIDIRSTVMISHIISAKEFYVQFETEAPQVAKITEELLNIEKLVPVSDTPKLGEIYAAQFSDDTAYYRAKLIEINSSAFEVFFIDFGNSSISNDIRILPSILKSYPNMAHKCCLDYDIDPNDAIDLRFIDLINNAHFGETFQMELRKKITEDYWSIKLYSSKFSKNIIEELREQLNGDIEKKLCRISHCNNPNDFYVQLCEDTIQLEALTVKLASAGNEFNKAENPEINHIYAAKFPDDGAYYRAKILLINNNDYEVIYIDFGNKAVTNDILELPEDLEILPRYAKQCKLYNTSDQINLCKKEEIEHFCSLVNSRVIETFQIQIIKNEKPLNVNLYYDNVNIIDEISKALNDNDTTLKKFEEDSVFTYLENTLINSNETVLGRTTEQSLLKDILIELLDNNEIIANEVLSDIINSAPVMSHNILQDIISKSLNKSNEDGASNLNLTAQVAEELYNNYQDVLAKVNIQK